MLTTDKPFIATHLDQAIRRYFAQNGKIPVKLSVPADASPYFGKPKGFVTWNALDNHLRGGLGKYPKSFSLVLLGIQMGLQSPVPLPDLDCPMIEKAMLSYYAQHGRAPTQTSGEASPYFGLPAGTITWMAIEHRLRDGRVPPYASLAQIKQKLRDETRLPKFISCAVDFDITSEKVEQAVRSFYAQHGGVPTASNHRGQSDASLYFELPAGTFTWKTLDTWLFQGLLGFPAGSNLHRICIGLGLRKAPLPYFDHATIEAAILSYLALNGRVPNQLSGDASRYFGLLEGSVTWKTIDGRLIKEHCSLSQIKRQMYNEGRLPIPYEYR